MCLKLQDFEEKMLTRLREINFYTDQDVMNDVCYGNIFSLPLKYNIVPVENLYGERQEEARDAMIAPVLLHYASKPWYVSAQQGIYKYWNDEKMVITYPNLTITLKDGKNMRVSELLPHIQPYYYKFK